MAATSGVEMKPGGQRAGAHEQFLLLAGRQLVGRPVEHDQRQDVGLGEARMLDMCSSSLGSGPKMPTRASTPEMTRVTKTSTSGARSPRKLIELAGSTSNRGP
jgi:hypothetical protein